MDPPRQQSSLPSSLTQAHRISIDNNSSTTGSAIASKHIASYLAYANGQGAPPSSSADVADVEDSDHEDEADDLSTSASLDPASSSAPTTLGSSPDVTQLSRQHSNVLRPVVPAPVAEEKRSDIAQWAPVGQLPQAAVPTVGAPASQLPDFWNKGPGAPTSLNFPGSAVQREMEHSIGQLLSEKVFEELMQDSLGRHRFREFLTMVAGDVPSLDLWVDLRSYKALTEKVKLTSLALHDVLVMSASVNSSALSTELKEDVMSSLRQGMLLGDSLELPQQTLLSSLYRGEFQHLLKHKLVEQASVNLGQAGLTREERNGLGDAFCITNPRLRDHPIVLVSAGFERLTGYEAKFICGRNCRMLAGPATSVATSKRIHDTLNRGEGITTLVLNYRRNGEPFWNLLCILPLRGSSGELTYFIGGQTEVTGNLAAGSHLSFLVGSENDPSGPIDVSQDVSPSLQAYSAALAMGARPDAALGLQAPGHGSAKEFVAGGQVKLGRQNTFEPPEVAKKGIMGFFNSLSPSSSTRKKQSKGRIGANEGQQIGNAEALWNKDAAPVDLQLARFANVYQRVIMFRRKTREIIFVTKEFLVFCDFPAASPADIFRSPLLHTDILDSITASEGGDNKTLRRTLKDAISGSKVLSIAVGIRAQKKRGEIKSGVLHLTPIFDGQKSVEAFVAV